MRRNAYIPGRQRAYRLAARFDDPPEALQVRHEAQLTGGRLGRTKTRVRIKGRQQRESDVGLVRGGRDAPGELTRVGERQARLVVVQVVELTDAREAGLEHLG